MATGGRADAHDTVGDTASEGDADGFAEALALVGRERPSGTAGGSVPARDGARTGGNTPSRDGARTQDGSPGRMGQPTSPGKGHLLPWPDARALAVRAGRAHEPLSRSVPLEHSLGQLLAGPLVALCDLPPFDTSAMDGWAVAGPGPWTISSAGSVLAGHAPSVPLKDGSAVRIATGARIPPEATAVLRSEQARTDPDHRLLFAHRPTNPGQDIRPQGQECRSGDRLLPASSVITPAVLGMAAAAGYDELSIVVRPRAEVLILGDELLTKGLPHDGLIRDALGPLMGPWLTALGADVTATRLLGDDADALHQAITTSDADLLLTTGGTAAGPVDHVHSVLRKAGAELLVDSVAVRPGHPMLLAALDIQGSGGARYVVGLPGNPLAAVSGLLTLALPLLRGLNGLSPQEPYRAPLRDAVPGHPDDTRLVPAIHREGRLVPLRFGGPAMLRGIAAADGLVVVEPGGARPGDVVELLDLPWAFGAQTASPRRFT
ncbi:molybdopterin molybdotransferase MoeA [Streptomyces albipurpureus]|uniref:Molybdopterin molybdenumtransferase n=1 Tax=Streptomyces albipurpureus TaxID=2897419 RepID=A0ABT0UJS4_9ACTN|nr:molybdopterin molybdotransferase MoeA [Streptomyces sp. CWNU-1]MCM2388888.1 molybdopterin molybdotransferase MoeA [Streptomyces sp. CWNU-1]